MKIKEYLEKEKQKRSDELNSCKKRIDELDEMNEKAEGEEDLKKIGDELEALKTKKAELEAQLKEIDDQIAELDKPSEPEEPMPERKAFLTFETRGGNKTMKIEERKAIAEKFAKEGRMSFNTTETRAVLVSGGKIATPTEVEGINDAFNAVSSIVDLVKVVNCEGMGSNKIAYEVANATATNYTEGGEIIASDPTFAFVEIKPQSIGVVSYLSKQVKKQSPLDYEGKTRESALKGLRRKAGELITNKIVTSDLLQLVDAKVASGKGVIDEHTLRNIALAYGGDENVAGNAVLFLNKKDLIAFGDVRGTSEKKAVYEITPDTTNPNTGIIQDGGLVVKYCINSNCKALNGTAQEANSGNDIVTMFYGQPENAELDLFGDYEIAVSDDFKFTSNMLTIKGDADLGAGVVKKDGFVALVLRKKTA